MKKAFIIFGILLALLFIYEFFFVYQIKLLGNKTEYLALEEEYNDNGIIIFYRGKKVNNYVIKSNINNKKTGNYIVKYLVNNKTVKERIINVVDKTNPTIVLNGDSEINIEYGDDYSELGVTVSDNYDKDIEKNLTINNKIDIKKLGSYNVIYTVKDNSNNKAEATRIVNIIDSTSPKIELNRDINTYAFKNKSIDMGYKAIDNYDGDITSKVEVNGEVNFKKNGKYYVTYKVTDSHNNTTVLKTSISVQDKKSTSVPVLMYHWFYDDTIGEKPGKMNSHNYISKTAFTKQMKYLHDNNFYYPTWQELEDFIDGKIDLPEKSVILTDDDGKKSFYNIAYPISKEYEIPFTSFAITSTKIYKNFNDVEYLDLESHTDSLHKRACHGAWDGKVMCSTYEEIYNDIKESIEKINNHTSAFAYPFGHYNDNTIKALKANGIKLAFTINDGQVKKGSNKYKLPRVRISSWTSQSVYESLVK